MSENSAVESNIPEVSSSTAVDQKETNSNEPSIDPKVVPNVEQADRTEILSKRQQKKLLKMAKWEEQKKIKRKKEKEKRKEKRIQEVQLGIIGSSAKRKRLKKNKIDHSPNLVSVAIDFDYDELMADKDIAKCSKQMLRVYTENRKSSMPIRLHVTSIKKDGRIEKALSKNDGYQNWDIKIHQEPYYELFEHDRIVYLSSDSDGVLNELDPNAVYIIGGLVDHNHHKGLSLERAQEKGFKTARLPLSEHIEMKSRSVLTIVHVFEILLKISEGKPWKETLLEVLPIRKFREGNRPHHKHKNSSKKADSDEEMLGDDHSENTNTHTDKNVSQPIDSVDSNEISVSTNENSV